MTKYISKLTYYSSIFLLFSCSGDDDQINPDPVEPVEPTVVTGVFVDSEVAGLHYSTDTQSGVTNAEGEFNYIEGETISFSVGQIALGSAPAEQIMSPVTVASTADSSVETEEVKNIAAFLQTLDSDNDPTNGILIETATVDAISTNSIDFTQPIIRVLGEIVAEVNLTNDSKLSVVYPETAASHLAETLGEAYESQDPVFSQFIPYLESQYGQDLNSYYWIHETNEEGELVSSYQYEKYPNRLAYEIIYSDFNEEGQPVALEEILFNSGGEESRRMTTEIFYTEDGSVESSISTIPDYTPEGDYWIQEWYTQFDDEGRVTEYEFTRTRNSDIPTRRVVNVYDDQGNRIEHLGYDLETGEQTTRIVYTYTDWGDKASETLLDASGNVRARIENTYRSDRTLEKQDHVDADGNIYSTSYYDENEERIAS